MRVEVRLGNKGQENEGRDGSGVGVFLGTMCQERWKDQLSTGASLQGRVRITRSARVCSRAALSWDICPHSPGTSLGEQSTTCMPCQLDPGVLLLEGHDKGGPLHHVLYLPP